MTTSLMSLLKRKRARACLAPLTLAALLAALPALLLIALAGAGTDPAQAGAAAKGYRSCFMERRMDVSSGTPRLVKERRCVFAE